MKDSTMILVFAAILAAATIPAIGTSLRQMVQFTDTMERVQAAAHVPSRMCAVSSNRTVRLRSQIYNFKKGWLSL